MNDTWYMIGYMICRYLGMKFISGCLAARKMTPRIHQKISEICGSEINDVYTPKTIWEKSAIIKHSNTVTHTHTHTYTHTHTHTHTCIHMYVCTYKCLIQSVWKISKHSHFSLLNCFLSLETDFNGFLVFFVHRNGPL